VPALADPEGQVWRHPLIVQGDRGYGYAQVLVPLMQGGQIPLIPLANDSTHGSGLGKLRFVVERTFPWFRNFRRIDRCFEKCGEHIQAFHDLAAALICLHRALSVVRHF